MKTLSFLCIIGFFFFSSLLMANEKSNLKSLKTIEQIPFNAPKGADPRPIKAQKKKSLIYEKNFSSISNLER